MGEEDHCTVPDEGLEQHELGRHGVPLLVAKGGGDGQHQQDEVGLWVAEGQTSADLFGHSLWSRGVGRPARSVHHRHLTHQTQTRWVKSRLRQNESIWTVNCLFTCIPKTVLLSLELRVVSFGKASFPRMVFPAKLFPLCFSPSSSTTNWDRFFPECDRHSLSPLQTH